MQLNAALREFYGILKDEKKSFQRFFSKLATGAF